MFVLKRNESGGGLAKTLKASLKLWPAGLYMVTMRMAYLFKNGKLF